MYETLFSIFLGCVTICIVYYYIIRKSPSSKTIYFVGPRSTGKTSAILKLLDSDLKTVPTIRSHKIHFKDKNIIEAVENPSETEFVKRFYIKPETKCLFFLKNRHEVESVQKQAKTTIIPVYWPRTDVKDVDNIIYLDESADRLRLLIDKI